jgi:hypothetical protein
MNRLVIIGNGFDLAHGLPTSYKDFIDDFWKSFKESSNSDLYKEIVYVNEMYDGYYKYYGDIRNFMDFKTSLFEYCKEYKYNFYDEDCVACHVVKDIFRFKNDFFLKINNESIENWVDIENLYYSELKKIVNSKSLDVTKTAEFWKKEQLKSVKKLNEEFFQIKKLFEKYLIEKIENQFELKNKIQGDNSWTKFYHILKPISIFNNDDKLKLEFNQIEDKKSIDDFFSLEEKDKNNNKAKSLLMSFNYTSTLDKYVDSFKEGEIDVILNQIHGRVNNENNKINFGFGDEMDDDYKIIENINENEYLKNFKSFPYLQNSNYSNLLSFIESEKFQVLILGHSCGLSDRTLLNTIFEHTNCCSIKIFYHQREDGTDNYTEIIQNISRHFNKKKLMREKIVNKTLCQPLPQIQLPKKT